MWAQESHNVGKAAYLDVTVNEKLTEEYIQRNVPVIEQQIVKGGVRLAKVIEFIFAREKEEEEARVFLK
jgi:hypothetical protein